MRRLLLVFPLAAASLLVACGAASPSAVAPATVAPPPSAHAFSGEAGLAHAAAIVGFGPRFAPEPGHARTIDYLCDSLAANGFLARRIPFTSTLPGLAGLSFTNVLGLAAEPTGPVLLLGAHFDSLPDSPLDPDPARRSLPLVGANDNAGGVGCLLELARALTARGAAGGVAIILLDAEERIGQRPSMFAGSLDLSARLPAILPAGISGFVLLDMMADADLAIRRERYSDEAAPALLDAIFAAAASAGSTAFRNEPGTRVLDDHVPFIRAGYPAVNLIDFDYPPWHTTGDTMDKISAASIGEVGRALERFIAGPPR